MSAPGARPPPPGRKHPGGSLVRRLSKHQVAALAASAVDFLVMIAVVEVLAGSPVVGTVVGAACGATLNFVMARRWIFRARAGHRWHQAARYVLVSSVSLGLNAAGEQALYARAGVHYVAARLAVALTVSVLWNFPMQSRFVFQIPRRAAG